VSADCGRHFENAPGRGAAGRVRFFYLAGIEVVRCRQGRGSTWPAPRFGTSRFGNICSVKVMFSQWYCLENLVGRRDKRIGRPSYLRKKARSPDPRGKKKLKAGAGRMAGTPTLPKYREGSGTRFKTFGDGGRQLGLDWGLSPSLALESFSNCATCS
jgi:hypothetical protein